MSKVFCFNADFDLQLGNIYSSKYNKLIDELSLCAVILSSKDDIVISRCSHDEEFCKYAGRYNLEIAEKTFEKIPEEADENNLWLWGYEKNIIHELNLSAGSFPDPEIVRTFNSRKFSFEINSKLFETEISYICRNIEEVDSALEKLKGRPAVIKPFFGSSAAGFVFKNGDLLNEKEKIKLSEKLQLEESGFVVEKWHNRIKDFSYGFFINREGMIEFKNFNLLLNLEKGMFRSVTLLSDFQKAEEYLSNEAFIQCRNIIDYIAKKALEKRYFGYVGIDGYEFRDEEGKNRIRYICEVNARNTMSSYLYYLRKRLKLNGLTKLSVVKRNKEKITNYSDLCDKLGRCENNTESKEGILLLTPLYYFKDNNKYFTSYMYFLTAANNIESLNKYSGFLDNFNLTH